MLSLQRSPPPSPSLYAPPSSFLPPRPAPLRRPSALRSASSDHILAHGVTRFDNKPKVIPSPSPDELPLLRRHTSTSSVRSSAAPSRPAPPIPTSAPSPPARPPTKPLGRSTSQSGSSGSLLARRRSSRSAASRPDVPLLSNLELGPLPTAGLEGLDDTVRPAVIGESAAAQTPVRDGDLPSAGGGGGSGGKAQVVVKPFKSTKAYIPTPFESRRTFLSDDDGSDEDDDEEAEKKDHPSSSSTSLASTSSTSASSVFSQDKIDDSGVAGLTEGVQWLPLQDVPAQKEDSA
ncbi:hypothetical protein JCM8097_007303 [Rhodosporidiobolus ruineniae]